MKRSIVLLASLVLAVAACSDGGSSNPTLPESGAAAPSVAPTVEPSTSTSTMVPSPTTSVSTTNAATTTAATIPLTPLDQLELTLTEVASGFGQPVFVTAAPGDHRLFVVDQPGRIWTIDGNDVEEFLDIRDRVVFGGEQGLLGLAFPSDYESSGAFYVNYVGRSNSGAETRISSFATDGSSADPGSEEVLLRVGQPASNHNGGMVAFGPDGNLWVGMGDGGARDDRFGHGQAKNTLLGAMLRLAVSPDGYTIPEANPGNSDDAYAPEVWAIGLRNPWRFAFDGADVWIADVGQGSIEEVNRVDAAAAAVNYGWPLFEGTECYRSDCNASGLTAPVTEYPHAEGCSITGGVVYRGAAIPELDGHYIYGDFCGGWVRSFGPSGETYEWFGASSVGGLASFGTDADGEVYVVSTTGTIWRIDPS